MLTIEPVERSPAEPGDFAAVVSGGKLLLPRPIAAAFQHQGVRTAADLLAYLQAFPTAAADMLRWQEADVRKALRCLKRQLTGHVPQSMLNPPSHPAPVFGAFDPDDLPPSSSRRH